MVDFRRLDPTDDRPSARCSVAKGATLELKLPVEDRAIESRKRKHREQ